MFITKAFFEQKITVKKYYNFIVKRFAKIFPLHIITFALIFALIYIGKFFLHQDHLKIQKDAVLPNMLMVHAWGTTQELSWNFPSWSISAEWFAYLILFILFPVILKIFNRAWVLFLIVFLVFFVWWLQFENFSMNKYTFFSFPRIIPEFYLGMLLGLFRRKRFLNKVNATLLFLGCLVAFSVNSYFQYKFDALCVLCFGGFILALSYPTVLDSLFSNRKIVYLGELSFSFYLLQFLSFIIFEQFFKYFPLEGLHFLLKTIMELVFVFGLNLAFAAVFYNYIEEPVRKYLVKKMSFK